MKVTEHRARAVDAAGGFELHGLGPTSCLVFAAEEGMGGPWIGVVVPPGTADVHDLVVVLPRRRIWRCTLAAGDPPAWPPVTEVFAASATASWFARAPVAQGGVAELAVGDGPFLVGMRAGYHVRWIHRASGLSDHESLVCPTGSLRIEGLDPSTAGEAVMTWIEATCLEGQLDAEFLPLTMPCGTLSLDATGAITVPYLLPGRYRITIRAPNWGRREWSLDLQPGEAAVRHWVVEAR
jgi:hypothetical protein